jgi:GDP-L-fucose synthase
MNINKKYLITGSDGLVGSALKKLLGQGHIFHEKKDVDLLNKDKTKEYFKYHCENNGVNAVIHCAAKVGGVQANMNNNKDFFLQNFIINNNVVESLLENEVPFFVNLLSTCIFPDQNIVYPLTSDQINMGDPHPSNHGYAFAKRLSGDVTRMVQKIYGHNWISVVPTNVYGEFDNFHLEDGHLVPAMIHRSFLSKTRSQPMILWGDGSPLRQLIYSEDLARLIIWALENWNLDKPFMAVNPKEHSVLEIATIICKEMGISSEKLILDLNKPTGQFKKTASTDAPDDFEFMDLSTGIGKTVTWFNKNYPNIRS